MAKRNINALTQGKPEPRRRVPGDRRSAGALGTNGSPPVPDAGMVTVPDAGMAPVPEVATGVVAT